MNTASVFGNRAYVVNDDKLRSGFEEEVLRRAMMQMDRSIRIDEAELMESNPDYDSYRVEAKGKYFNIKLSFDKDSPPLYYERDLLTYDINPAIGPKYLTSGVLSAGGSDLLFLLTSWDFAENLTNVGRGVILSPEGLRAITNAVGLMGECSTSKVRDLNSFMADLFAYCDINSYFFDDSLASLDEHSDLKRINALLQEFKSEITSSFDDGLLRGESVCHGSLGMDTVLYRQGACKFRNFEKAFVGSQWIDVARLVLDMGLSGQAEQDLINNIGMLPTLSIDQYRAVKRFYAPIYLLELAISYLMEVYIFSSSRPTKIIEINTKFVHNFKYFTQIKLFNENKEFITKLITEPIIGFTA